MVKSVSTGKDSLFTFLCLATIVSEEKFVHNSAAMPETAKERFFRLLALYQAGQIAKAEAELEKALRQTPKDPNLLHLAAQVAESADNNVQAASFYRRALVALPDWPEATFNLARVLNKSNEETAKEEAVELLTNFARNHPKKTEAWETLARLEQASGKLPQAAAHWRELLSLRPDYTEGRGQYYLCLRQLCDWRETPEIDEALAPQIVVMLSDEPELQRLAAQKAVARRYSGIKPLPPPPPRAHKRLRVGYLSSDFHEHATLRLMAELFALHDRGAFEIFIYSYGIEDGSELRARLKREAEHFIDLAALTPLQCAQKIREDEIDVLIDLKGHTHGGRLDVLAYRPAPVQMHWLGFPGTTGAQFIQYFVGDSTTIPIAAEEHFTEKVLRMPHTYQINNRQKRIGETKPKSAYGLPEDSLVLASFNQTYKITPETFDLWCDLLHELPSAVLWLHATNAFAPDNLRREAEKRGIDPSRLVFAANAPQEDHLARYCAVDLALDTFPVGGHTTTSDALWAGVPVVTREGRSFASRVAASLLRAAEMPLLVTSSPEEYRKRVLDLAHNKAALDSIRNHLKTKRDALPLFDAPRFVKDWEKLLSSCAPTFAKSSS